MGSYWVIWGGYMFMCWGDMDSCWVICGVIWVHVGLYGLDIGFVCFCKKGQKPVTKSGSPGWVAEGGHD